MGSKHLEISNLAWTFLGKLAAITSSNAPQRKILSISYILGFNSNWHGYHKWTNFSASHDLKHQNKTSPLTRIPKSHKGLYTLELYHN